MTVTAYLCSDNARAAIDFYARAFGAEELSRIENDDGRIGHLEFRIGETTLFLSDEWPEMGVRCPKSLGGHSASLVLDAPDLDAEWQRALDAGATVERPITDAPHGRGGWLIDPSGYRWHLFQPQASPS